MARTTPPPLKEPPVVDWQMLIVGLVLIVQVVLLVRIWRIETTVKEQLEHMILMVEGMEDLVAIVKRETRE